jgi:hypothetical protein
MSEKQLMWLFIMVRFSLDAEERKMIEDEHRAKSIRKQLEEQSEQRATVEGDSKVFADALQESNLFDDPDEMFFTA